MPFSKKLKEKTPTLSFEFFPPKNPTGWGTLYSTLGDTSRLGLDYVSVTYGAGGSTREKTIELVSRIQNELDLEAMAHLTCVGHSKQELADILSQMNAQGIKNVLGLRGDPPKGVKDFKAHAEGFAHASELIEFIAKNYGFNIGCACYPEMHPQAKDLDNDILYLKRKQDLGASFAITQLFFGNDEFLRFRDKSVSSGVTIPIIAGIMPVTGVTQLDKFKEMCGCSIPDRLLNFLNTGDSHMVVERGIDFAIHQCEELLKNGVAGIHLYTLNKSISSLKIAEYLQNTGFFPKTQLQA